MFLVRRRKGFFTLIVLASFVILCTWLLQLKFDNYHNGQPHHHHQKLEVFKHEDVNNAQLPILDVDDDDNNHRHPHDRILLLANTVSVEMKENGDSIKLSRLNKFVDNNDENNFDQVNIELQNLFKYLHHINSFIVDINLLNEIQKYDNESKSFEITYNYLKAISKSDDLNLYMTFGVYPSAVESILSKEDLLKTHYDLNCEILESNGLFIDRQVVTNIYLICKYVKIQLAVFYHRNEYLWIGKDDANDNQDKNRWFGDLPRALHFFNLTLLSTKPSNFIFLPANIKKFLFDYNVSKFIECNRTLVEHNIKVIGESYKQNLDKNKMLLPVIKHISTTLEGLYKHYWLAGGTLLGWYRDCGIIPHTQDVDFAIWADEYENEIKKAFLGNKIVRVWGTLGLVNDSFEFRMYNDLFTFDMFLVYKHNDTHNWCGYQVNKVKFRRWLPKLDELCSAELLNNKFMVPCDPVGYLNKEYGKPERWVTPQSSNYTWSNVNHWKSWTDDEWPHVIKYYDKAGKLLKPKIIAYLNKHTKKNITEVPDDPD